MAKAKKSDPSAAENGAPHWKASINQYRELRALIFESEEEIDEAIEFLWTDAMYGMPHDIAGGDTLIVPPEAVAYFRAKGWKFRDTKLRSMGDLSVEEKRRLRGV